MRIVIKIGSHVLADPHHKIDASVIEGLTGQISELLEAGQEIVVVSSGAVLAGKSVESNPGQVSDKSLLSGIGQPYLASLYGKSGAKNGVCFAQYLLVRTDFTERERYDALLGSLNLAMGSRIVPLLNENDVLSTSSTSLGDNDMLAAMIAIATSSAKLIILTNLPGLYTGHPELDGSAKLIPEVHNIDRQLERLCKQGASELGTGGMLSKVRAAKHAVNAGIETYIADGKQSGILNKILNREQVGTKFTAEKPKILSVYGRWILAAKGFGQIIVDKGASVALSRKKSLLLPGITQVKGTFDKNDVVEIMSDAGLTLAYGKVGYNSREIQQALNLRKKDPSYTINKEVIHRDYMVNA